MKLFRNTKEVTISGTIGQDGIYLNEDNYNETMNEILNKIIKTNEFGNLQLIQFSAPKYDENVIDTIIKEYNDRLDILNINWRFKKYVDEEGNESLLIQRGHFRFTDKAKEWNDAFKRDRTSRL